MSLKCRANGARIAGTGCRLTALRQISLCWRTGDTGRDVETTYRLEIVELNPTAGRSVKKARSGDKVMMPFVKTGFSTEREGWTERVWRQKLELMVLVGSGGWSFVPP